MNKRCHLFLAAILFFAFSANMAFAEKKGNKASYSVSCIAFYNLENLFDTINDPAINDEEYLPDGPNKWNSLKYNSKLENMAYAISKIGLDVSPVGPVILGVAEIENRGVLEDLVKQPAIKDRNYQIVHYDSPDRRGVDVGLLYNPDYFTVTNTASHRLHVPENPELKTRDQLLVSGYVQGEKIHVIVNHWPSRYGGELYSRPNRNAAAALTKSICDSIYRKEPKAKIIIMGDLNDDPSNESCAVVLGAKKDRKDVEPQGYFNTLWKTLDRGIGSLGYNDSWNLFDQLIISGNLANADSNTELAFWKSEIFNKDFLIVKEGQNKGYPKRTHTSGVWTNGYSDHFPVIIYLIKKK
ncbi:MAG: endonuclease/exonuclease/phosphatase family protein [Bacteroidetes bacterium]|uniref:Endonuclease/exonuclease/phosphatase family protein n=1 Tax=Candidatus Gallipaludibacter merdavium TaxID=2840839 RepID=A0A9D9N4N9_9BACT|nr:endonuclease/exonuclease/phosphatase family protein [Candidatus Gallipaludibacter merdavium]